MPDTTTVPRALLAAMLLVGALAPLGVQPVAAQDNEKGCNINGEHTEAYIRASTPLSEHYTASQLLHMAHEADSRQQTIEKQLNGADAYIYDLGCEAYNVPFALKGEIGDDLTSDEDTLVLSMTFFDEDFDPVGDDQHRKTTDENGHFDGKAPDRTRYIVISVLEGPVISGINYEDSTAPQPYSASLDLWIAE